MFQPAILSLLTTKATAVYTSLAPPNKRKRHSALRSKFGRDPHPPKKVSVNLTDPTDRYVEFEANLDPKYLKLTWTLNV